MKKWKVIEGVEVLGKNEMREIAYQRLDRMESVRNWESKGEGWRITEPERQSDGQESMFFLQPTPPNTPPVLFNPELDILFLADPPSTREVSRLSVLVRWLEEDIMESVKNPRFLTTAGEKTTLSVTLGLCGGSRG